MKSVGPLVSIIVPVYNVEKYLEDCIDSIVLQTYSNLEIILVDDGSTDASGEICDYYAKTDKRIRVFHKKNGGLSDARNFGILRHNGDFIAFIDSDDWISSEMIESLLSSLEEYSADIAITGYTKEYKNNSLKMGTSFHLYSKNDALKELLRGVVFQDYICTMLFKSSLWEGISFPVGKLYEDIRTSYKLFLRAKTIITIEGAYYHYRQRANSIVKSGFSDKRLEVRNAVLELYSVPDISNNTVFLKMLDARMMRIDGFLSQEVLLSASNDVIKKYENIVKKTQKRYQRCFLKILLDRNYNKSLKLFALYSLFGYSFLEHGYKNGFPYRFFHYHYEFF